MNNKLNILEVATLITVMFFFTSCSYASKNEELNLIKSIKESLQKNKSVASKINISKNISIPVAFDTTKKGNGTLNLNGLLIRIFDQHDDGVVYQNSYLNLELKDLNDDNIKEIIFTGIIKYTGEKETDPVSYEPISNIYQLNCYTGFFVSIYSASRYSIEIRNTQRNKIKCK